MPKARKKSTDPVQERLRSDKDRWNEQTRELISGLIAFKRALNGKGDNQFGLPPSDIKEPLPSEIGSFLHTLSSDFQSLMSGANSIISEQASYAQTRKKKQPPKPKSVAPPPSSINPIEQALNPLASSKSYLLEKYGSSRPSRFWQYFKGFFSKKELDQKRIGLLKSTADVYYDFLDFENNILTLNSNSLPAAFHKYQIIKYNLGALYQAINQFDFDLQKQQTNLTVPVSPTPNSNIASPQRTPEDQLQKDKEEEERLNSINLGLRVGLTVLDRLLKIKVLKTEDINALTSELKNIELVEDEVFKIEMLNQFFKHFNQILKEVEKTVTPEKWVQIQQITAPIIQQGFSVNGLIKQSHNSLSRFLRKKLVKTLKYNKTAAHRLKIADLIDQIKKVLQNIMNTLEKDLPIKYLKQELYQVMEFFNEMRAPLSILSSMNEERYYNLERELGKGKNISDDKIMDLALKRKVRKKLFEE